MNGNRCTCDRTAPERFMYRYLWLLSLNHRDAEVLRDSIVSARNESMEFLLVDAHDAEPRIILADFSPYVYTVLFAIDSVTAISPQMLSLEVSWPGGRHRSTYEVWTNEHHARRILFAAMHSVNPNKWLNATSRKTDENLRSVFG